MRTGIDASKKTKTTEIEQAIEFAGSTRGVYIISQALLIASEVLTDESKPVSEREPSNAADMLYMREHLFPFYFRLTQDDRAAHERALKVSKTTDD